MADYSLYNSYLQSQGWTPTASAAILGNAFGESAFDANAIGDNGAAFGLFQIHPKWHPGFDPSMTGIEQVDFVSNELKSKYPSLARTLNSASDIGAATKAFMTGWEKPASLSSLSKRIAAAVKILNGDILSGVSGLTGIKIPKLSLGGGNDCGSLDYICKLRKWIDESHFFQRIAIGILALIILGLAIWMLGNKQNINIGK